MSFEVAAALFVLMLFVQCLIQNGAAQTHDFNRGISRVPIPFVFVYCKNIYNIV